MAYQIQIVPSDELQSERAWIDAVGQSEGVRIAGGDAQVATNPMTGEEIRIQGRTTDAEIFFPDEDAWYPAIFWCDSKASINARFELGDEDDPAWIAVSKLTQKLNGQLCGEEGEIYDALTGKMIRNHLGNEV